MNILKHTGNLHQAFLILTNKSSDPVIDLFNEIRTCSKELGHTFIIFHDTLENIPDGIKNIRHHAFTDMILNSLSYIPIKQTLVPGSNHFPLLDFYLENPFYDFYWYIEDDVRFNGNWVDLFKSFSESSDVDFISCHLRVYHEEPSWIWWDTLSHPDYYVSPYLRIRSFNPIYRISNAALEYVHFLLTDKWQGHHEVLLPTLLHLEGFSIMDFGGTGKFVNPGTENKFYIGNSNSMNGNLSDGTMRYRPLIKEINLEGKLYHPVK